MDENFLLRSPLSQKLYHECASLLPLIDYHNHLSVKDLLCNRKYDNPTQLWIANDPYKHRAMRICGVDETFITGNASDFGKFEAWMSTLPSLIGNPLYDWSVLELNRIFNIDFHQDKTDVQELWDSMSQQLNKDEFSALSLLSKFNVEYAAPCMQITEDVSAFSKFENIAASLRGDSLISIFRETIDNLEKLTYVNINSLNDLSSAVEKRIDDFDKSGCKFADHALDAGFKYLVDDGQNENRFKKILDGVALSEMDNTYLSSELLRRMAREYAKKGWTLQLHIGALRNTSDTLRTIAGAQGGFAGIGSGCDMLSLARMLNDFEKSAFSMPDIVLFTLNPSDHAAMAVLSGSYTGKVQLGPAWWWCDHLLGMRDVFETISTYGVLSVFIGMTTDSRSILSFIRHEYFRRALCGWIGEKVEKGEFPSDYNILEKIVQNVCYNNVKARLKGNKTV